jgi:lipoprotein-anchoring transpeptidase ErfK/SrfK
VRARPQAALALVLAAGLAALLPGCGREAARPARPARPGAADSARAAAAARPAVTYQRHPVGGAAALRAFQRGLSEANFRLVLKVNRRDLAHVRDRDTLAVPYPFVDELEIAPFPAVLPGAGAPPKLVLVSLRVQAFGAYEGGRLRHWGPTSTGRRDKPTPPGLYHANWKAEQRTSTIDDEWLLRWCVNIENSGISLHQYDLPGYPASHSCVRLLEEDARRVYDFVDQWQLAPGGRRVLAEGTPVVIFGEYGFGRRPPWKSLPDDPRAADVPLAEVEEALRRYLPGPGAATESAAAESAAAESASP